MASRALTSTDEYHADPAAWSQRQAELIRARRFAEVDWDNVAEEVEDLSKSERAALHSYLRLIMLHMLKWDLQVDRRGASWQASIAVHRVNLQRVLRRNPSLRRELADELADDYADARKLAAAETAMPARMFPLELPYTLDDILKRPFTADPHLG